MIYSETRLCPYLFDVRGLTPREALTAIIEGLDEGQKEYKVDVRIILCFIKNKPGKSLYTHVHVIIKVIAFLSGD